jgi:hypothetical protein
MLFEMPDARVQDLFDAQEFRAQQIAGILDAAVRIVEAAVQIAAKFTQPAVKVVKAAVVDQNADQHG